MGFFDDVGSFFNEVGTFVNDNILESSFNPGHIIHSAMNGEYESIDDVFSDMGSDLSNLVQDLGEGIQDITGESEEEENLQNENLKMAQLNLDQAKIEAESLIKKTGKEALYFKVDAGVQMAQFANTKANSGISTKSGTSSRRLELSKENVNKDAEDALNDAYLTAKQSIAQAQANYDYTEETGEIYADQSDLESGVGVLNAGFSLIATLALL